LRHQPHGQAKLGRLGLVDLVGVLEHLVNIHLMRTPLVNQAVEELRAVRAVRVAQELLVQQELLVHLEQQAQEELVVTVEQSCLSPPK
jgi:hypothetical protein